MQICRMLPQRGHEHYSCGKIDKDLEYWVWFWFSREGRSASIPRFGSGKVIWDGAIRGLLDVAIMIILILFRLKSLTIAPSAWKRGR